MLTAIKDKSRQITAVKTGDSLSDLISEAGILRLQAVSENIIRIRFTAESSFKDSEKPGLLPLKPFEDFNCEENDTEIVFKTAGITARIDRNTAALSFFDENGRLLLKERSNDPRSLEAFEATRLMPGASMQKEKIKTADGEKEVIREAVRESTGTLYHCRTYFDWQEDEALYGLGQHEEGFMDLRGKTIYMHQANRKIAIPMMVSSLGYGLFFNNYSPMIFSDNEYGSYIYCEAADGIDYFIINGGNADGVIRGYRSLTGKAALLPRWAFGYIQSQERYESAKELTDTIGTFREKNIGVDCIVLDWLSWPDNEWGQKSFDEKRFPDPAAMMDKLHEDHAHLMISIWPNISENCPDHKAFAEAGLFLPGSNVYNAFDEKARALYWEQVREGLYKYGLDAFWCDSSEPYTPEWMHRVKPEPSRMYEDFVRQGSDHMPSDLSNAFAFYHAQALFEGQRGETKDKRVLNLTRSSTAGQQRFGTVLWSGDIEASWACYRRQIAAGLNFCASGLPYWTNDIGAFFVKPGDNWFWKGDYEKAEQDPAYCELYLRWFQFSAFLPVFRAHGTDCRREPWNFMAEGGKYYDALCKTIKLRYSLLPHIYSLAGRAWLENGSIIRMLSFDYPDDKTARDCGSQFMLGEDMMICPVTDPGISQMQIYLPDGDWCDYYSGERFSGGRYISRNVTLDEIPVFVKAGSVIPTMEPAEWAYTGSLADSDIELIFRIYTGRDAEYLLYDDAGDGYGYEQGEYTLTKIRWNDAEKKADLGGLKGKTELF